MVLLSFTVAWLTFLLQPPRGTEMVMSACRQADHEHLLTLAKPLSTVEAEGRAMWGGNETWEARCTHHTKELKTAYPSVTWTAPPRTVAPGVRQMPVATVKGCLSISSDSSLSVQGITWHSLLLDKHKTMGHQDSGKSILE